jgi:hypothetical protein
MIDNIWQYLNNWIRQKFKETFTEDVNGDTAFRVVGSFSQANDDPNEEIILNEEIPLANVEHTISLPADTRGYWIKVRSGVSSLKLAYEAGETATNFYTIAAGNVYYSFPINFLTAKDIYISSSSNSIVVEIKIHKKV